MKNTISLSLFLHLLIGCALVISQNPPRSHQEDEILDLNEYINNFESEINDISDQLNSYKLLLQNYTSDVTKLNPFSKTLILVENLIKNSKSIFKNLTRNFDNLTNDYENDLSDSKEALKGYQEVLLRRKKYGIDEVNKLMNNFLFKNKTRESLEKIIKILNSSSADSHNGITKKEKRRNFLNNEKTEQFSKMRIQSSFRLDEIINHLNEDTATGVDFIRAMLAGFYSSLPPTYCWVDDTKLGTFDLKPKVFMKRIANILYEDKEEIFNFYSKGGIHFQKCPSEQTDCLFFCSTSDCNSPKNFISKIIEKQIFSINPACGNNFKKKGTLCYHDCEKNNMVTCDRGICAPSKLSCKREIPKINYEIVEAFVDFLGHIYSMKENQKFGWASPENFKKDMDIFKIYNDENTRRQIDMKFTLKDSKSKEIFRQRIKFHVEKFLKIDVGSPNYYGYSKMLDSLIVQLIELFMGTWGSPRVSEISVGILSYCKPKFFSPNTKNMTPNEIKRNNLQSNICGRSLSNFLGNLQHYMLIGYSVAFVKPICQFPSIKNSMIDYT